MIHEVVHHLVPLVVCSACGEEKPQTDFPKNGKDKDGNTRYRPDCKVCYSATRKIKKHRINKFISATKHRTGEVDTYTVKDWRAALIHFKGCCAYCGEKPRRFTKDHIHPVSKGGTTVRSNIVPACSSCNYSKNNSDLCSWFPRQRFYSVVRMARIKEWRDNQ